MSSFTFISHLLGLAASLFTFACGVSCGGTVSVTMAMGSYKGRVRGTWGGGGMAICSYGEGVTVLLISIPDLHLAIWYPRW